MAHSYPHAVARQVLVDSSDAVLTTLDFRHLEVALSRLRKKIQDATGQGLILASRSEGYLFGALIRLDSDQP
jgi:DNA-binding response OmpR family regulator